MHEQKARESLTQVRRIVVKVGTHTLASRTGRPNEARMRAIAGNISMLHRAGMEVVLVSSGAVGMGLSALKLSTRPKRLADLQMAAAVGQARLMSKYQELFLKQNILVGQVLLTSADLHHRTRHLNARATLTNLLSNGIVPIINENDAISVDEIRVGDNDTLAAQVSLLLNADALVLLTTVNGLRKFSGKRSTRVPFIRKVDSRTYSLVSDGTGDLSVGGMRTKLDSASQVVSTGGVVVIADGRKPDTLKRIFRGEDVGTLVGEAQPRDLMDSKQRWLAFFPRAKGSVQVDAGAAKAILTRGKSLLPVGVTGTQGSFEAGALVTIADNDGKTIARGLVSYSSDEIATIQGCRTSEIEKLLGARQFDEIVHRDNMVLLEN